MSMQLLWLFFQGLKCSISNLRLNTSSWTYGQPRHVTAVPGSNWILYWNNNNNNLKGQNNAVLLHSSFVPVLRRSIWGQIPWPISRKRLEKKSLVSAARIEDSFTGKFLLNGVMKTHLFNKACSTAWDTHHIKKWAKVQYLNYIKWDIKYVLGVLPTNWGI